MSIVTQSALLASIVLLALAAGVLINSRRSRPLLFFSLLSFLLSLWSLSRFLFDVTHAELWKRIGIAGTLFIPIVALHFFRAWLGAQDRVARVATQIISVMTLILIPVVFSPLWSARWFGIFLLTYVYASLLLCDGLILLHLRESRGPVDSARLKFLAVGGVAAIALSFPAYVPAWAEMEILAGYVPAAGNAVIVIFMYFLSQMLLQYRLLDVSELVGKLAVLGGLVLLMASIYGVLSIWATDASALFFFHIIIASFVVLILFEPLKAAVEATINRLLFRDRFRFVRQLTILRREIANVVELDDLTQLLLRHLEDTRRVTHASLYILEDDALHYRLAGSIGEAPPRLEVAKHRRLLDALKRERVLSREELEDALAEALSDEDEAELAALLREMIEALQQLRAALCLPIVSEERVIGLLNLNDERMTEPYASEDVRALVQIASQAAISIENSRVVRALRERDRLAALGEMAAGLAHEIRNPLGAIKGAAQYLALIRPEEDHTPAADADEEPPEAFLGIIIDETNRLNTVVSQFLDYARPQRGELEPCLLHRVVERTLPLVAPEAEAWQVEVDLDLPDSLPHAQGNAEQLRQVVLNLALNAVHATGTPPDDARHPTARGSGPRPPHVILSAGVTRRVLGTGRHMRARDMVEIVVYDNGKGIPEHELPNIFIPFFTTKPHGTGLGLAVSQRLVEHMGGRIEVTSAPGEGATFRVLLPLWDTASGEEGPGPPPA